MPLDNAVAWGIALVIAVYELTRIGMNRHWRRHRYYLIEHLPCIYEGNWQIVSMCTDELHARHVWRQLTDRINEEAKAMWAEVTKDVSAEDLNQEFYWSYRSAATYCDHVRFDDFPRVWVCYMQSWRVRLIRGDELIDAELKQTRSKIGQAPQGPGSRLGRL